VTDDAVLAAAVAMRDYPSVIVDPQLIVNGKVVGRDELGVEGDGPWAVVDADGNLLAMYEPHRGETVKPAVLIA
jgi:hypothetical protein